MATITPATAGMRLTAAWLNQFIPGSMAACGLMNSWANHGGGSTPLSARLMNAVTGHLVGAVNPGTTSANTQIGTLPSSAYYPVSAQQVDGVVVAGTNAGQAFKVLVQPTGAIQLTGAALSGATEVVINGVYPLDI